MKTLKQVAAVPYRFDGAGRLQVLLVTSRETQRWVVPKGWPWPGLANHKAAVGEAWEEAGVRGRARKRAIGSYVYEKVEGKRARKVKVNVYLMAVSELATWWPEKSERKRAWFVPGKAAEAVIEPELKLLLAELPRIVVGLE